MIGLKKTKSYDITKLIKKVKRVLSASRFEHTMGVAYTAASLAMRYECDINHVMTAGILHDCAKYMNGDQLIAYCEKNKIEISETERLNNELLHAKVGSKLAEKKYGIKDSDILNAILYHTTGKPNMSLIEKIIYIADFIEPGRKELPNIAEIRKTAFVDIDKSMILILQTTLSYLKSKESLIDKSTQETYDYFVSEGIKETN